MIGMAEADFARKSGEMFTGEMMRSALYDEYGMVIGYVVVLRDVTERKQHERELRNAKETAERANNAKSDFLSSMSHELRTPMNSILGFAQLLESTPNAMLDGLRMRFVNQILKSGNHLLSLIDQVLAPPRLSPVVLR